MYIRWVKAKSGGTVKKYAQLVEGYRVSGKKYPKIRVLLSLGPISQLQFDNIAAALAASRCSEVVIPKRVTCEIEPVDLKPIANLRYADLSLLLELAKQEQVFDILTQSDPEHDVEWAKLTMALVLQRCVEPSSKLGATRWVPKTALVELLGLPPEVFNNTRIHRALTRLEGNISSIQARLASHYHAKEGGFASLFIDTTDTWFVGQGPEKAEKGKTKEGFIKRKIGIVMMCNEHGYPMRWAVRRGSESDCQSMEGLLESVARLPWLKNTPVICDRAMGKPAIIARLAQQGIRFVTALPRSDAANLGVKVPWINLEANCQKALQIVSQSGFIKVNDNLWLCEQERIRLKETAAPPALDGLDVVQQALKVTKTLIDGVHSGRYPSEAAAASALGIDRKLLSKNKKMLSLPESVQNDILAGAFPGLTLAAARKLGKCKDKDILHQQLEAARSPRRKKNGHNAKQFTEDQLSENASSPEANTEVRVVTYFNPDLFEQKRRNAEQMIDELESFVASLNTSQVNGKGRRGEQGLYSAVDAKLRKYNLLKVFSCNIVGHKNGGRTYYEIKLKRDEDEWQKRRQYDGYSILLTHSQLEHGPEQLAHLYRAKDTVEKDFQVIKSVARLRPVRHRTDIKVSAHVAICVLSLLLERVLQRRLKKTNKPMTAEKALGELSTCALNLFQRKRPLYVLTTPTAEQRQILTSLGLQSLIDDASIEERITPRTTMSI